MIAILLGLALVFSTVQCKFSCTASSCEKAPPCHQKTIRSCSHEIVLDRAPAVAPSAIQIVAAPVLEAISGITESFASQVRVLSVSPPLRI